MSETWHGMILGQACFFNHFAAMQVNEFSETLSLAENSLSLAKKILELSPQFLSLDEISFKSY